MLTNPMKVVDAVEYIQELEAENSEIREIRIFATNFTEADGVSPELVGWDVDIWVSFKDSYDKTFTYGEGLKLDEDRAFRMVARTQKQLKRYFSDVEIKTKVLNI